MKHRRRTQLIYYYSGKNIIKYRKYISIILVLVFVGMHDNIMKV